jgi:hypothetical protein
VLEAVLLTNVEMLMIRVEDAAMMQIAAPRFEFGPALGAMRLLKLQAVTPIR